MIIPWPSMEFQAVTRLKNWATVNNVGHLVESGPLSDDGELFTVNFLLLIFLETFTFSRV